MSPAIPEDFGVVADIPQVPVVVLGSIREFGTETPIPGALLALWPVLEEESAGNPEL